VDSKPLVWNPQASAPITSETHKDGGAVIRKPGSAWLEGTPAMNHTIMANAYTYSQMKETLNRTNSKKHGAWMQNTLEE